MTRASLTSFCQNALPSTRAIETRSLPPHSPLPIAALPSMSLPPKSSIPDRDVFYVARPARSVAKFTEPEKTFLYMDL